MIDGRPLRSGRAGVMNVGGFILDGILFGLASLAAFIAFGQRGRAAIAFLVLGIAHAGGTILVGLVHSGPREMAQGLHSFHVIGAGLAIIGGNAALVAAAIAGRSHGAPDGWRLASVILGLCGLLALALFEVNGAIGGTAVGPGLLERASVYPITAWEMMTGLGLLLARKPLS